MVEGEYDWWLRASMTIKTVQFFLKVGASMTIKTIESFMMVLGEYDYRDSRFLHQSRGRV